MSTHTTSRQAVNARNITALLRDRSVPQLEAMSLNALLDGKTAICAAIAIELSTRLHAVLGNRCPECSSKRVAVSDEEGECSACGATWHHEDDFGYSVRR